MVTLTAFFIPGSYQIHTPNFASHGVKLVVVDRNRLTSIPALRTGLRRTYHALLVVEPGATLYSRAGKLTGNRAVTP